MIRIVFIDSVLVSYRGYCVYERSLELGSHSIFGSQIVNNLHLQWGGGGGSYERGVVYERGCWERAFVVRESVCVCVMRGREKQFGTWIPLHL